MPCIATFETAHMALRFEKTCRAAGIEARIVPVPRALSTSCGLACSYPCEQEEAVRDIACREAVDVESYHTLA